MKILFDHLHNTRPERFLLRCPEPFLQEREAVLAAFCRRMAQTGYDINVRFYDTMPTDTMEIVGVRVMEGIPPSEDVPPVTD